MVFKRGPSPIALSLGLVVAGIVAALAWQQGTWGLGVGAALVALWLAALNWWLVARPRDAVRPDPARTDDADGLVLRLLLDAAPTPLLAIDATAARALNRAARRLFATDDRILPVPPALTDATATHLRHEGRGWRIDRVRVANGQDVAALIDIEQEERAAEARASAEMIQVLGHELLNGLAPIASLAESGAVAVARPQVDVALLREILDTLARRAEGLQRFTEAYRAIARLPEPTRRAVPVGELTDDLARLFATRWPAVALSVAADADAWTLDRDQIVQAVWALLQNAAEAATTAHAAGAQVALRVTASDTLAIEIEDNGAGVPADAVARIFRPFHTTKADGTGVGLSLARQIALAHGGTLTLASDAPTRFRLTIP
ncbi:sensor histidine kinase [Sphingomonas aquatilis]|uniref:sensor histidine kinase n=1 Tax=Sphingomonas aquatilis TaxID=93063 RepID=UPI0023F62E80|nr:HAMP domain-containing sensor histidine kinase [Sphingomonas aquatilis]MCI4653962.1 HAMP domain-containing histidine kinase [Sphingomonas aquatilis]